MEWLWLKLLQNFWQGAQFPAPATQNDIWRSKRAPYPAVFWTCDFDTCFAPQRSPLFQHRNCQKCSEPGELCTFWLRHVLRATAACNCSSLIWPDGSAPAAWKNSVSRPCYLFGHLHIFFLHCFPHLLWSSVFLSSLLWLFPSLLFSCPYCRKFDF